MVMAEGRFHGSGGTGPGISPGHGAGGGVRGGAVSGVLRGFGRAVLPALALLAAAAAGFAARNEPLSLFNLLSMAGLDVAARSWFTMGQVWVLVLFLIVNLTGRRFGAGVTAGAVALAFAIAGGVWAYAAYGAAHVVMPEPVIRALTAQPMVLALFVSLGAGLLIDIVIFDLVRGRPWWKAPLVAPFIGAAAYALLFHALAGPVLTGGYLDRVSAHLALLVPATLLMLLIYHLFRPVIRPLPGYGGA